MISPGLPGAIKTSSTVNCEVVEFFIVQHSSSINPVYLTQLDLQIFTKTCICIIKSRQRGTICLWAINAKLACDITIIVNFANN